MPDGVPKELNSETIADYLPLAHRQANFHQQREADHWDLVQEGMTRLLEIAQAGVRVRKPGAFAQGVFRNVMSDYYKGERRQYPEETSPVDVLESRCEKQYIDDAEPIIVGWAEFFSQTLVREFLAEARRLLPARANLVLRELHTPSAKVVREAEQSGSRKRVLVTYEDIRRAHDIPSSSFWRSLRKVRALAEDWWGRPLAV